MCCLLLSGRSWPQVHGISTGPQLCLCVARKACHLNWLVQLAQKQPRLSASDCISRVQARQCNPAPLTATDLRRMLACRVIAFVGDSVLRYMGSALVSLLDPGNAFGKEHHDVNYTAPGGARIDFFWRLFVRPLLCCRCYHCRLTLTPCCELHRSWWRAHRLLLAPLCAPSPLLPLLPLPTHFDTML